MICPNPNCKHEIPDNSSFCPDCGTAVADKTFVPNSIRHLGHLDLIPTSMEKWKWGFREKFFLIPPFIIFYIFIIWFTPVFKKKIIKIADYIEQYKRYDKAKIASYNATAQKYAIFVRDGKCGVLDVCRYKVSAEAIFTSLKWRNKDKYLVGVLDGKTVLVDVNGYVFD